MRGIFIFFLLSIQLYFSQQIEVVAKNTSGKRLYNINVQLQKEGRTLAFRRTNEQGVCIFTPKEAGTYTIKFTSMRYKTQFLDINTTQKTKFVVTLRSEVKEIKEVTIKARPKISKAKGDTISYNIKAIKDGTERTAGDLIKKIPGLDINDNGKVTHNGNQIGQILVEGNEFFGKNHQMSTQNITADMLEGVDLWKNYTTINGNTSTALNLKLKDKYKGKITGSIEGNYGSHHAYLAHTNLYKFTKIGNLVLMTDFNNLSQDPISFMDFHEMNKQEDIDNVDNVVQISTPSFLNNDDKIKSKNNQFGALQYAKSSKKTSVSAFSILNFSQLKKESKSSRTALENQSSIFNFLENKTENNKGYFGTTQLKIRRNLGDKNFIYYNFGYNPVQDNFKQNTNRTAQENSFFNINNIVKSNTLSHFLSWNKYFGKTKTVWAFHHLHQNFNEDLNLNSNEEVFNINDTQLAQNYNGKINEYALDFYLKHRFSWVKFDFHSGYKKTNVHSDLVEKTTQSAEKQNIDYHRFLNGITLTKYIGNFDFLAFVSSNWANANQQKKHYFENKFRVKFRPDSRVSSEYSIDYTTQYQLPKHQILFDNLFYTKNLRAQQNQSLSPLTLAKTKNISFNWHRFNLYKGDLTFVIVRYSETKPAFTTNTENYSTFSTTRNLGNGKQNRWFLLVSNQKNFGENWTLKTKIMGMTNKSDNWIANQPNEMKIRNLDISQKLSTHFKKFPLQFDLGYRFSETRFSQTLYDTTSKNENIKISLGIRTAIGKEWKAHFSGDYFIQKTANNRLRNFLLGGHFSYQKKQSPLEIHLRMNNILNLNSFRYINNRLSSFGFQEQETTALRGYIIGGMKYHF